MRSARVEALWKALSGFLPPERLLRAEPMRLHTTLKIGGAADVFACPASEAELARSLQLAAEHDVPVTLVGRGSNLLVLDGGIRGLTLCIGRAMGTIGERGAAWDTPEPPASESPAPETPASNPPTPEVPSPVLLYAQAGATLRELAEAALARGLSGLEFAHGIPGGVGGGVFMNAGAYGGEMKDVVHSVRVMTRSGDARVIPAREMAFGYRASRAQAEDLIVTGTSFLLTRGDPEAIRARMAELAARRRAKQPLSLPSCGSVFKRPEGYFAGTLIDECGLKGARVGGASVSDLHANFLVNDAGATAADYLALIALVQRTVRERTGVSLVPEVRVVGEETGPVNV